VPLSTTFHAVIDGTNGNTYLNEVNARLQNTAFVAKGAITGTPGVKGRSVEVQMTMGDGRIEDLLALTVKSKVPALTGRISVKADLVLPPGPADVVERLKIAGQFDLSSGRFTGPAVQEKLAGMSARASGKDPEDAPATVMSDLEGRFRLASGSIWFGDLRFRIPGAGVRLAGSYGLRSEALEFDGTLRMDATISEAAGGGMKSIFLKIVDPFFKKKGAGAVLPIRVRGTRADPKFGLDVGKALTPR
jgi:hypothetical protein